MELVSCRGGRFLLALWQGLLHEEEGRAILAVSASFM